MWEWLVWKREDVLVVADVRILARWLALFVCTILGVVLVCCRGCSCSIFFLVVGFVTDCCWYFMCFVLRLWCLCISAGYRGAWFVLIVCKEGCRLLACLSFCTGELLGRVSSDLAVMSRAMKMLCDVTLEWGLKRVCVFRRRFRLAFLFSICSDSPSLVLGLG